jgi:hypothetical protein
MLVQALNIYRLSQLFWQKMVFREFPFAIIQTEGTRSCYYARAKDSGSSSEDEGRANSRSSHASAGVICSIG